MKLVVGLGNPGEKYARTRHNLGFMVVDKLGQMVNGQWSTVKKFNSLVIGYQPLAIFAKPTTFMNSSGNSVKSLANYYKIQSPNVWVIYDDLDIKLGQYKIQKGVGPKLHYGVQSIESKLRTKDFWHVRVGVDNRKNEILNSKLQITNYRRISGEEYVLQEFTEEERKILDKVIEKLARELIRTLQTF